MFAIIYIVKPKRRKQLETWTIIGKVRNGKSWLWHDQNTDTYWRSLKAARKLTPSTQRVKKPKNLKESFNVRTK